MRTPSLERVAQLTQSGELEAAYTLATELAAAHHDDVAFQVTAAYSCDRLGHESEAVAFYDRAWHLGVPDDEQASFLVGYGSTLRNVGRTDEAIRLLEDAVSRHRDNHALRAFLALALHSAGRDREAVATMLRVALDVSRPDAFDGYERALDLYQDELSREG